MMGNKPLDDIAQRPELAVAPVAVSVKPLDWSDPGLGILFADTIIGTYKIKQDGYWWLSNGSMRKGGNVPAAKAAAQSDFNARILSSIIPATKSGEEPPICSLMRDNGDPEWKQINALFLRNGINAFPIRLRDELSNMLAWARYGEALAALSAQDTDGVAKP